MAFGWLLVGFRLAFSWWLAVKLAHRDSVKEALRARGLTVTRTQDQLEKALIAALAVERGVVLLPPLPTQEELNKLPAFELKNMCKDLNLPHSGSKLDCIAELNVHYRRHWIGGAIQHGEFDVVDKGDID